MEISEEEELVEHWKNEQAKLAVRVRIRDEFSFHWPLGPDASLKIGGLDISFVKDSQKAVAVLAVVEFPSMRILHIESEVVEMIFPYISTFLAFREAPSYIALYNRIMEKDPEFAPNILMIDGNGILHPRGCGIASHVGVILDIPCLGVAKKFCHTDGISKSDIDELIDKRDENTVPIIGKTRGEIGKMLFRSDRSRKPIFVSPGHRITIKTAVELVSYCCKYRIPEPVRHADLIGRDIIRTQAI